ncbi:MAG: hypothetical protein U0939_21830 [Pirellulales bacterium]
MISLTYVCPECDETNQVPLEAGDKLLTCARCGHRSTIPAAAVDGERVERCVVCPSHDLYVRKDFSQPIGVSVVILGMVLSSICWYYEYIYLTYGVLFAIALIDVALYVTVGNVLQCYRCHAQYRGVEGLEGHQPFSLETHEKHRQQQARLEQEAAQR